MPELNHRSNLMRIGRSASPWADARVELGRLLADPNFNCSTRNKRFLEFICDELFEGRDAAIKAYTIAVDVFGRPANFDPSLDPIVRIEATRLRAALAHYYEVHGHRSRIHLHLPKGRYVPEFIYNQNPAIEQRSQEAPSRVVPPPVSVVRANSYRGSPQSGLLWLAAVAGLANAVLLAFVLAASGSGSLAACF